VLSAVRTDNVSVVVEVKERNMNVRLTKHESARCGYGNETGEVFQYEVRGYPPGEGASITQMPHENWTISRWNTKAMTERMGDYLTADDALAALQKRCEQGDSAFVSKNQVTGTLDILWTNFASPAETPTYHVLFLPYQGFKDGAQRPKVIVGKNALKIYLRQLHFQLLRIYAIFSDIETQYAVSLPNVFLGEYEYAVTYRN
jgi:hypothetical protein